MKIESENITDHQIKQTILNSKIKYAKNIVENGQNKGLGFNYKIDSWDTENTSGQERRIKLLLNINDTSFHSLTNPLVEDYEQVENEDQWVEDTIKIKGGVNLGVLLNSKLLIEPGWPKPDLNPNPLVERSNQIVGWGFKSGFSQIGI